MKSDGTLDQTKHVLWSGVKALLAPTRPGVRQIILWWELRRIAYNLILLPIGFLGLLFLLFAMESGPDRGATSESDFVPFLSGLGAFLIASICYTFGWITNCIAWFLWGRKTARWGPVLWSVGTALSIVVSFLPGLLEWA